MPKSSQEKRLEPLRALQCPVSALWTAKGEDAKLWDEEKFKTFVSEGKLTIRSSALPAKSHEPPGCPILRVIREGWDAMAFPSTDSRKNPSDSVEEHGLQPCVKTHARYPGFSRGLTFSAMKNVTDRQPSMAVRFRVHYASVILRGCDFFKLPQRYSDGRGR